MSAAERWQPADFRSDPDSLVHYDEANVYVETVGEIMDLFRRPAWHARAACRGKGPDAWFPVRGQPAEPAKKICAGCPVQEECLAAAMADGMTDGTWGGTTRKDRQRLHAQDLPVAGLVALVEATPDLLWRQRMDVWNAEHPERPFRSALSLSQAWRQATGAAAA